MTINFYPLDHMATGLSGDSKPTGAPVQDGWRFLELDTEETYRFQAASSRWLRTTKVRALTLTADEKAALDNAPTPLSASNPVASVADAGGGGSGDISSPLDIDGCQLWLDASDPTTINAGSPADDDPVSLWADKSGNGYDAAQATGINRPTFKTAAQNGLSVVRFVGQSVFPDVQYLMLSGAGLDLFRNLNAVSVFYVAANPTEGNSMTVIGASAESDLSVARLAIEYHGDGVVLIKGSNDDSSTGTYAELGSLIESQPVSVVGRVDFIKQIMDIKTSATGGEIQSDLQDSPGSLPDAPSQAVYIGNSGDNSYSDCDYCEIAVFNRFPTLKEVRQLLEYGSAKWGTL